MAGEISIATREKQDEILSKIEAASAASSQRVMFKNPGTFNWVCPPGVKFIKITMFGAGGSGGTINDNSERSDDQVGGWGGSYISEKVIEVVPGTTYPLVVGKGGAGTARPVGVGGKNNGQPGGATSGFDIMCPGGYGGTGSFPDPQKPKSAIHGSLGHYTTRPNGTTVMEGDPLYGSSGLNKSKMHPQIGNPSYVTITGGGHGYGSGDDAAIGSYDVSVKVSPGAGSGACLDGPSRAGGDGIIIIEW